MTTSTRADNLVVTMKARATDGRPVTVFDPQGMSGLTSTLRWSPVRGCEDPDVATRRALVISADSKMSGENAAWQKRAQIVLQCLLHAAALSGEGIQAFRRWSSNPALASEALDILNGPRAALGWHADLMGILDDDPRNTSNSWIGVSAAVAPLSSPRVLAALDPVNREDEFDPQAFIRDRGTLYLIGTKTGAAAAGPYLSALIDDIDAAARDMAFIAPGGRLDPPLSLILDEIANLSPWPGLPIVLSDGGGIGISTMVVLQSLSQARSGWSIEEAATIWESAIIKVIFGGGSDERDLRDLAVLARGAGHTYRTHSWSSQGRQEGEQIRDRPSLPCTKSGACPPGQPSCWAAAPAPSCWTCAAGTNAGTQPRWAVPRSRPKTPSPRATSTNKSWRRRSVMNPFDDDEAADTLFGDLSPEEPPEGPPVVGRIPPIGGGTSTV